MKSILLGSGLGAFVDHFEVINSWPFADFIDFSIEDITGHERMVYKVAFAECEYIIVSGKLHHYESGGMDQMGLFYQNVVDEFNLSSMLITASSAGLVDQIRVGEWYRISGLILGSNVQFARTATKWKECDFSMLNISTASYAFQSGPSLGTLAEYKMLKSYGAQLVGMSILPETHLLNKAGVQTIAFSIPVCNYAPLDAIEEPGHQEVVQTASQAVGSLVQIFKRYIKEDKR